MVRARLLVLLACLGWFASGCADAQHPSDESASSDDVPRHTSHRHKKKKKPVADEDTGDSGDTGDAPKKHTKASSDDADDSDAPRRKTKKRADDDSDDDDTPKKHSKKTVVAKKHAGDDDDDDDDAAAAKKRAAAKKAAAKKQAQERDAEDKAEKKKAAEEKAAEDRAARKKAADEKAAAKKEAAEERAAAKKEAEEKEAEKNAAKKKAAEDDTPKVSDDDDDEDDKPKSKAKAKSEDDEVRPKAKAVAKSKSKSDDDDDEVKPKPKARAKAKADDDDGEVKPKPKAVAHADDKPEPPKKQRSIEEDIAVDDPLASAPPVRTASSEEEGDDTDEGKVTSVAAVAAPKGAALQDRSLTTPQGQLDLHAGLPIGVLSVTDATGMATSSTSTGLALGVAYGVNAKAELGFDYTLGLSPGAVKGPITLHGAYSFTHGRLDFAGAAALAIDFADTVNPATMTTTTSTAGSLELGAWVRYHASPTVTLFSGLPGLPNATSGLSRLAFALPLLPYQIQIGFTDKGVIALTLPVGVGYQASAKLYTFASLDLANIRIANTSNAFLFKDFIPLAIGGFYQVDTWSLGASFADDLKQGFGYLRFELIARYLLH